MSQFWEQETCRDCEKMEKRIAELEAENERLRAEVHECPDCGEACKQCSCFESELAECRPKAAALGWLEEQLSAYGSIEIDAESESVTIATCSVSGSRVGVISGTSITSAIESLKQQLEGD